MLTSVNPRRALQNDVETLVDRHGLYELLCALAEVAHEKANHVRHEWGDEDLANAWEGAASYLEIMRNDGRFHF